MKISLPACLIIFLISQNYFAKAQKPVITVTKFRDSAQASAWCPYDSTLVAYNLLRPNGYNEIYLANLGPGNTPINEHCFTCLNASLPGKNYAQPCFQSSGKYMLFTAEKAHHSGNSNNSIPGIGTYNDLWVMTMDGSKAYQLTNMPDSGLSAIIEPWFNPKGNEIMWCQMTDSVNLFNGKEEFGYWVIKIAPFIDDSVKGPHIDSAHIRTIMPGGTPAFNEPYGWSPDGSRILFASDYNQFWVWDDQIYSMDTNGNNIEQMSSTAHDYPYCEHAFYSADGKHVVWMTNENAKVGSSVGGDDWFIMNSDTTKQERLTYFNDTTSSYWTGSVHINGHGSFCPNNKKFLGDVGGSQPVQVNAALSIGANYIITTNSVTGIKPVLQNKVLCYVYPDPATTFLTLVLDENMGRINYSIYNLLGDKLKEGAFTGKYYRLDVSTLPDGIYFLKIDNTNISLNKEFVVQKQ